MYTHPPACVMTGITLFITLSRPPLVPQNFWINFSHDHSTKFRTKRLTVLAYTGPRMLDVWRQVPCFTSTLPKDETSWEQLQLYMERKHHSLEWLSQNRVSTLAKVRNLWKVKCSADERKKGCERTRGIQYKREKKDMCLLRCAGSMSVSTDLCFSETWWCWYRCDRQHYRWWFVPANTVC